VCEGKQRLRRQRHPPRRPGLGRGADIDSGNTAGFVPFCCNSRSMFRQLLGSLQDLIHPNAIRGHHIIETKNLMSTSANGGVGRLTRRRKELNHLSRSGPCDRLNRIQEANAEVPRPLTTTVYCAFAALRSVCSIALLLVCLDWKSDSLALSHPPPVRFQSCNTTVFFAFDA